MKLALLVLFLATDLDDCSEHHHQVRHARHEPISAVPEPGALSYAMVGGLALLGYAWRRIRK